MYVQELALRIMATLEWLNGSHQLQYARTPAHAQLNKLLVLFLNNLVAGHMLDPQLYTQKLHDMMSAPLLADTTPLGRLKFQPLSSLRSDFEGSPTQSHQEQSCLTATLPLLLCPVQAIELPRYAVASQ